MPTTAFAAALALAAGPGLAQGGNPWTPETVPAAPTYAPANGGGGGGAVYPGDSSGAVNDWSAAPAAPSRYAPADLEQQLSVVPTAPVATAAPTAPATQPGLQAPSAQAMQAPTAPVARGVPQAPAQATAPGYGAMPYAAPYPGTYPYVGTPVVPGVGTYPGAMPYGAVPGGGYGTSPWGYGLPYGSSGFGNPGTGWGNNGWSNSPWPGGSTGTWPMGGFSPFSFW